MQNEIERRGILSDFFSIWGKRVKSEKVIIHKGLCASSPSKSLRWYSLPLSCRHMDTHPTHAQSCIVVYHIFLHTLLWYPPFILQSCAFRGSWVSLSRAQKFIKTSPIKGARQWENRLLHAWGKKCLYLASYFISYKRSLFKDKSCISGDVFPAVWKMYSVPDKFWLSFFFFPQCTDSQSHRVYTA